MPRAKPFEFMNALRDLGIGLASTDPENDLASRPNRLMRRLSRAGLVVERTKPVSKDLTRFGFKPNTVFDIGVDAGTPFLYDAFPNAHFVLVDPVAESEGRAARWLSRLDAEFHCCAVGAGNGEAELTIPAGDTKTKFARSTTQEYTAQYSESFEHFETRSVPMLPLDDLIDGKAPPFGIKIDTEGGELSVIKGAKEALKSTDFVVAEVSIRERFSGGYRFSEFVAEMGINGFEPLEFLTPFNPQSTDCDVLFVRYDGPYF
ncbi:MAG: FkbM family methyltransferase [Pseudomonadota bacterium]